MKKIICALGFLLVLSSAAYADGNAFTPLNFNDTGYGKTTASGSAVYNKSAETTVSEAVGNGNQNMQMLMHNTN